MFDEYDMKNFWIPIGCLILLIIACAVCGTVGETLLQIPFQQSKCDALGPIEHEWKLWGGCFVKDPKTGAYMTYSKWESINGTLDLKDN